MARPLVLASRSTSRARLLRNAGLDFIVCPQAVDEEAVKSSLGAGGASAEEVALALAELKAVRASARNPEALVIGADQMLECGGKWFDQPEDLDHAGAHLRALRGRTHELYTAQCVALGGGIIWHETDSATLTMRHFSDRFVDAYIAACGEAILGSVGAYRIEEIGVQLFSSIQGDHFTILGLSLLPLLAFLRQHGIDLD